MWTFRKPGVVLPAIHHDVDSSDTMNSSKAFAAGHSPPLQVRHDFEGHGEKFTFDAQPGVVNMEAVTTVWTRNHLIAAYVLIWIISFVDALQQGTTGALTPYITSSFQQHSLTAYTGVMSSIIGGILKLPLAKILDIFGRPHGFTLSISFLCIGLVLMATCQGVQHYAAAQIFYWVGYNGMSYAILIFVADTSSLKNRGFMFAYTNSPYIITVWLAGPLATVLNSGIGFRWGFAIFVFLTLAATSPLIALFWYNYRRAVKIGIIVPTKSNRTFAESCLYYFEEFDAGGLFLLLAGLVLFLLPFSLYSYEPKQWKSPMIIVMLVVGFAIIICFVLYEKYIAPRTFIPYELLTDRTVLGSCTLAAVLFVAFYLWDSYFTSFLQIVNGLSIRDAQYMASIYSIGSCFFSLVVGYLVRRSKHFKWIALYFGVPFTILGVGLMINFRQPDVKIGYIVLCQILIAFAGGACVITEQIAIMAATSHQYVAVVLALEGMFSSIGGGIGSSIAAAIWTSVFPKRLTEYLPEADLDKAALIYGSLVQQLSYPKGTATRAAIERAYGDTQKYMLICAASVLSLGLVAVLMWRNINVQQFKQTKGLVA